MCVLAFLFLTVIIRGKYRGHISAGGLFDGYGAGAGKGKRMKDRNDGGMEHLMAALKKNRYEVSCFSSFAEARDYLVERIQGKTVGFGDSQTLAEMRLEAALSGANTVYNPGNAADNDTFLAIARKCLTTEIFLTSVNAITQDGVLLNMDGTGNRVAGSLFGHSKVYYIVGKNKIVPDVEAGFRRIKEIAAPLNAKRLGLRTPCAKIGKCMDCSSPDRICNVLSIQWKKMNDIEAEMVLVGKDSGF